MLDAITSEIISNFDFTYVAVVNIVTYSIIKFIDKLNKNKKVKTTTKRFVLLIVSIIMAFIYYGIGDVELIKLINSAILAPVAWSWILKPICKTFDIDYKSIDKTLK